MLDGLYSENLQVTSTSANGWVSDEAWWGISYAPPARVPP